MKKKYLAIVMLVVCLVSMVYVDFEVKAEEVDNIELSYLLTDEALIGYAEIQTRGIYLAEGYSAINKLSTTTVGVGGITNAALACRVSVTTILERQTSAGWTRVNSWTQTNDSALSAIVSKSVIVGTGYYYRVRSSHYASTDSSSSCTSSLKM